jgi:DNA-directed RNA polymerase subunit beta'
MRHFQDVPGGHGSAHADLKGDAYAFSAVHGCTHGPASAARGRCDFPDKALCTPRGPKTLLEKGGLFDERLTGGMDGKTWTHIDLPARIPNPMFEQPIQVLLGITSKEFDVLVSPGHVEGGRTGFQVLSDRLSKVDVKGDLKSAQADLRLARGASRNKLYKKVRYLRALDNLGLTPVEAYTNTKLPVIPPAIRKVSIGYDGSQIVDDLNSLYLAVGQIGRELEQNDHKLTPRLRQEQQASLYDAVRALRLSGLDQGTGQNKRHFQGLMEKLKGDKPKTSFFQNGVLSKRQDLSGRSVIIPEVDLSLDEVGIPTELAMEMYKPFVIRRLTRDGVADSPLDARKMVKEHDDRAIRALRTEVSERPVILKRDPALHKFSMMGFHPRLVAGKAVQIHPLVVGGFNADFDGDQMAMYVPVSEEAVQEVREKMLPSKNLFSPTHGGIMLAPSQDGVLGIYHAGRFGPRAPAYDDAKLPELMGAVQAGKIKSDVVVLLQGRETTAGRRILESFLPLGMRPDTKLLYDRDFALDKKGMKAVLTGVAQKHPAEYSRVADGWKKWGYDLAYLHGSSFRLNDFHDVFHLRDEILAPVRKAEESIRKDTSLSKTERDAGIVAMYTAAQGKMKAMGTAHYAKNENHMYDWARSGARGDWDQFGQLVMAPVLVADATKKTVPVPISRSFGEGLSLSEYMTALHGARKGTIDRASGTADPGALTKDLINTVINHKVREDDCGTRRGIEMQVQNHDIEGRYLAADTTVGAATYGRNALTTPAMLQAVRQAGVQTLLVRSPLYCLSASGVCTKCYGLDESGKPHAVGVNVGIIAGHAMGEPVTQMQMKTFHTGGAVGSSDGLTDYFKAAKDLFMVPEVLAGEAVISTKAGQVTAIADNIVAGGKDVTIGGKVHRVPAQRTLRPEVIVGATVQKAQSLTDGRVNPHHVLKVTGSIEDTRRHLTDSLMAIYPSGARQRNVETVVAAMTDVAEILDPADHPTYLPGQTVSFSELSVENRRRQQKGLQQVEFKNRLRPMTRVPQERQEDWMARLNYQRLEETYQEGAAQGWESNIVESPVAGIAHGARFGLSAVPAAPLPATQPGLVPVGTRPRGSAARTPRRSAGFWGNLMGSSS